MSQERILIQNSYDRVSSPREEWQFRPYEEEEEDARDGFYGRLTKLICLQAMGPAFTNRNDLYRRKVCRDCYEGMSARDRRYCTPATKHLVTLRRSLVNFKYCLVCTDPLYAMGVAGQCRDCIKAYDHLNRENWRALELGLSLNVLEFEKDDDVER